MASLLETPCSSNSPLFSTSHRSFQPQKAPFSYYVPYSRSSAACPLRFFGASEVLPPPATVAAEEILQDKKVSLERIKDHRKIVKLAWEKLVRWSRYWRSKVKTDVLERTKKVVVLGGGSFGTAMAAHVAHRKAEREINMLVRDPDICHSINESHCNCKYFPDHKLPENVIETTDAKSALLRAEICFHAVAVQFSSSFLEGISEYVDPSLPFISLSKGLELNILRMMSQIIPRALKNSRQPSVVLSGPSFALELMNKLPTAMAVSSKDKNCKFGSATSGF